MQDARVRLLNYFNDLFRRPVERFEEDEVDQIIQTAIDSATCCGCAGLREALEEILSKAALVKKNETDPSFNINDLRKKALVALSATFACQGATGEEDLHNQVERLQLTAETYQEAYARAFKATYQSHNGHWDSTGQSGAGCPECIRASEARQDCQNIIKEGLAKLESRARDAALRRVQERKEV